MSVFLFAGCVQFPNNTSPSIHFNESNLTLEEGQTFQLQIYFVDSDGVSSNIGRNSIEWISSDNTVATVADGLVTAVREGKCAIIAMTEDYVALCEVTVVEPDIGDAAKPGYRLVWRDEFDGDSLDLTKWGYQLGVQDHYGKSTGPKFWGNNEMQYYTKEAVTVSNGALVITATRQDMDEGRSYASGRILTRDLASWTYGYFEARIKTPTGNGMWPAFWMLPQPTNASSSNNIYGGWPNNGEIDIMEAKGRLVNKIDTTLHFGTYGAHDYAGKSTTLPSNTDEWHTYALEWTPNEMIWHIDGRRIFAVTKDRWWSQSLDNQGQTMPFDQPFFILLNLAVGGTYDGNIAPDDDFTSASMYVDYVRVYESKA